MNNSSNSALTRELCENKYKSARSNLLAVVLLSVVNLILLYTGSMTMMLFSASIPYYAAAFGYYSFFQPFMIAGAVIAAVFIVLYLLCWFFSKKHYGWMIAALVLFGVDTLFLAYLYIAVFKDISGMMDALFHVLVLYFLIIGVANGKKLSEMPEQVSEAPEENSDIQEEGEQTGTCDTTAIRAAQEVKCKVFLEHEAEGHKITYRRVKRVNELVIDGYVYSDVEMLLEVPHELCARIDGHLFVAGMKSNHMMYISVDGNVVKKKIRFI